MAVERRVAVFNRTAAEQMRPVFDRTDGVDGFVSLEVSPDLAYNTEASIAEARRLWKVVDRPNLMIKVPATDEGIPAIETLLAEGININITLMFSLRHYDAAKDVGGVPRPRQGPGRDDSGRCGRGTRAAREAR